MTTTAQQIEYTAPTRSPRSFRTLATGLLAMLLAATIPSVANAEDAGGEDTQSPWHVGAQIELTYEYEQDFDLDSSHKDNEGELEPEFTLDISYRPTPLFQAFAELELSCQYGINGAAAHNGETELKLNEAYLASEGIAGPAGGEFSVYIGRRQFADDRQWLYDEELDGATLRYDHNRWSLAVSVARERNKNLLSDVVSDEPVNYIVYAHYQFDERELGAYVLKQEAQDGGNEEPLFIGIQSSGDLVATADYWLQLGLVRGHDGSRDINGWGLDAGIVYTIDAPLSPSLIAAYAYGSGDDEPNDGVIGSFRQTGMQDNEEDLGGRVDFHYLGVALAPEISNIEIFTAGVGIQPEAWFSTRLVAHYYRQAEVSADLDGTQLDVEPEGRSGELGYGIDWVTGVAVNDAFSIEVITGYFHPGDAFEAGSDNAWYFQTELEYEF